MKQSHTMFIYKADKRTKSGERLVSTTVWQHRDEAEMKREVRELQYQLYPTSLGFRIEFHATMQTVKSLMTGKDVEISATDRGTCLDPSQERFWCM
jgi:type I restriction-modification system DNA methylase subunit